MEAQRPPRDNSKDRKNRVRAILRTAWLLTQLVRFIWWFFDCS